jgi:hypothetical protein
VAATRSARCQSGVSSIRSMRLHVARFEAAVRQGQGVELQGGVAHRFELRFEFRQDLRGQGPAQEAAQHRVGAVGMGELGSGLDEGHGAQQHTNIHPG